MSLKEKGILSGSISSGIHGSSDFEFTPSIRTKTVLAIENVVSNAHVTVPLTGIYSPDFDIDGWLWDRRLLPNSNNIKSMYNTYLGGHLCGLREGVVQDYWQSGSIDGIDLLKMASFKRGDYLTWTPKVQTGSYAIFWSLLKLYSDYSFTGKVDLLINENGFSKHILRDDCLSDTISVTLFERDESLIRRPYYSFNYVSEFSGEIDDSVSPSARTLTLDEDGNDNWKNVSKRKKEFCIRGSNLWLNGSYSVEVGSHTDSISTEILENHYQSCGKSNSTGRLCFSNFFPIASNSLEIVVVDSSGNFELLKEVDNLNFSRNSEKVYSLDEDLGIVTIGGYKAPDLILADSIDKNASSLSFLKDGIRGNSYPRQGILKIGAEEILYYGKGSNVFYDCIRGYNGTVPEAHSSYSIISDIQHGYSFADSYSIYMRYTAVPRIQYEVTDHTERSGNKYDYLDVKPTSNSNSNKIIQISSVEKHVDSIVLETSSDSIGGNLHGPVYYGTDFSELCATVYDSVGNVVEDIETTIVLSQETVGSLNGTSSTYTALTNSAGQICTIYNAPYDWESVAAKIKDVSHSGSDTIMTFDERPPGVNAQDVTIFQVLKHDSIIGTVGEKVNCLAGSGEIGAKFDRGIGLAGFSAFTIDASYRDSVSKYEDGFVDLLVTYGGSTIKYRREIAEIIEVDEIDTDTPGVKLVLTETCPHMDDSLALTYAWLYEREAKEWNGTFLDGVKVVVYEWKDDVINPNTSNMGAYYPLRPNEIQPTQMTFSDRSLSIPEPFNQERNLGGYFAVMPDMVKFHAYAKDPVSGRVIMSNEIRVRLDLPAYLNGVDKSNPALPIPYGFTFVTEDFNVGSGIEGANFLTINPKASGVNSYSLFLTPTSRGH